jgi:predicted RNA methylase
MVVAAPEQLTIYSIRRTDVEAVHEQDYAQRGLTSDRLRPELAPDTLLAAKRASRQLTLFPMDVSLLADARRHSSEQLASRVEEALALARSLLPEGTSARERYRLVVGAIAALMVRDKLALGRLTGPALMESARVRFPAYFGWLDSVSAVEFDALDALINDLEQGLDYRGLDPAIVSDVYERAVIDHTTRKEFGVFYTPPELARRMAAVLPFEEVPPEERVVVDLACGSGTLLLAAQDRLLAAVPAEVDFDEAHTYVTRHLFGFDQDAFAVEIARLSLLLNALPIGNDWRVEQRDAIEGLPADVPEPRFVISNPPWDLEWSSEGRRLQIADEFVRIALDDVSDGGHVALVLPASFLESRTSRKARRLALGRAAVTEVWRLPEDTFRLSRIDAVVAILKKGTKQGRYLFRRALPRSGWQQRFFVEGKADTQRLVSASNVDADDLAFHGPLDGLPHLLDLPHLDGLAHIQTGPVPTPGYDDRLRETGKYRWLRKAGSLKLFGDVGGQPLEPTHYPEGFNWRRKTSAWIYNEPKVLVSAVRTTSNPWRLRVGVDSLGVIPRQSLHLLVPKDGSPATVPALAALLASSVAACWVDTHSASRSIRVAVLKQFPAPTDRAHWRELDAVGRRCMHRAAEGLEVGDELIERIEEIVSTMYDLGPVRKELERYLAGFEGPEDRVRFPPAEPRRGKALAPVLSRYFGTVLEVQGPRLRLWIPGLTGPEGKWTALPDRAFAALCEEGTSFEVRLVDKDLKTADFRLQAHSYEDVDELATDLLPQA